MRNQPLHPRTAAINHTQKHQSKTARLSALTWLAKQFPKAFDNTNQIQPLKIGITQDILQHAKKAAADGISKSKLREAVIVFTRRIDYLTCLKAREMRIDLNGNPTKQVSPEEAEHAALKIRRRIEKTAKNARAVATTPIKKTLNSKPSHTDNQSETLLPAFSAQQALMTPRTN